MPQGETDNTGFSQIMYSFRIPWTGVTYYYLYSDNNHLCSAATYSSSSHFSDSFNSSSGRNWFCKQPRSIGQSDKNTIDIVDQKTKKLDLKIFKINQQLYILKKRKRVLHFHEEMRIQIENHCYYFYMQQKTIAKLVPQHEYNGFFYPADLPEEAELRFMIFTNTGIAPDILAQVNAFPLLIR